MKNIFIYTIVIVLVCHSADGGTVGQWLFEEGPDGTTFYDTSGYGNHGTLSLDEFFWSTDAPPSAEPSESWSIGSTVLNSYGAVVQDDDVLDITEDFSIEFWVKSNTGLYVLDKHTAHVDNDGSWNVYTSRDVNNGDFRIAMGIYGDGSSNSWTYVRSDWVSVPLESWVHAMITYDDGQNEMAFYVNGAPAGTENVNLTIQNTTQLLEFGPHDLIGDNRIASVTMYDYVVPEPATLSLLAVGALALIRRRRNKLALK